VSCHSAQPVQKLAATPEMLNVTKVQTLAKMMLWALARVSFCAAKIVSSNNKKKFMVYLQNYFNCSTLDCSGQILMVCWKI
jgi:hypothetical protein